MTFDAIVPLGRTHSIGFVRLPDGSVEYEIACASDGTRIGGGPVDAAFCAGARAVADEGDRQRGRLPGLGT